MKTSFNDIFKTISTCSHSPKDSSYKIIKKVASKLAEYSFGQNGKSPDTFGPFGPLILPYCSMGNVSSTNLFDLDELIIFSFYWFNRQRYHNVADIGANIGLHSIIMSKCGYDVNSYEPDPKHFVTFEKNLTLNNCRSVKAHNKAVSDKSGTSEFIRLLDNTTGSHLAGAKCNPYGGMQKFTVELESSTSAFDNCDLIKVDAEGHEKQILLNIGALTWEKLDALVEVGSLENANAIFSHFTYLGINLFAQLHNWQRVVTAEQMPKSYKDGSLFITSKSSMPWPDTPENF